jgi:hypothetical protein
MGGFFQIFGGGVPVMLSTLYSIAADVSSEEDKSVYNNPFFDYMY